MLKIAICDDEVEICSSIELLIKEYSKANYLSVEIDKFCFGKELLSNIKSGAGYDLLFLDIELNSEYGNDIGNYIREVLNNQFVSIVYISSYTHYAMKLFKSRPMDFIEKPITIQKIENVFKTFFKFRADSAMFFEVKNGQSVQPVLYRDIIYFTSKAKKIIVVTKDNTYSCYGKINDIGEIPGFVLIHKSFYININYVKEYKYRNIELINGDIVPISQPYRVNLRKVIMDK